LKILYFSPHPLLNLSSSTGYGRHMREMIAAMRKNGHEVQTLIMGGEKSERAIPIVKENSLKKIAKAIIPKIIWESFKDYRLIQFDNQAKQKLNTAMQDFGPDLVYERGNYLMPSGTALVSEKKVRHILEINGPYIEERVELQGKSLFTGKASRAEEEQIANTNLLVVVSSPLKEYFIKKHSIPATKILVTPNAVNFDDIVINGDKVNELRKELHLDGKTVIGFVGSIFPYHGVDILIEAFSNLKQRENTKNLSLLIIGDGETLEELKAFAIKKGLKDDVIFTGKVPHNDIYNYIELFDIAIMAKTNWYCSPIKIFEYGALQKPIIAPDTQSVRDVIVQDNDGLLVNPNAKEIATAMQEYLSNIEKRKSHGLSFYNKIKNEHVWQIVAKKIIDTCK
jgi:glycosyltransferase involved in cell wall biosynthesis